MSYCSSDHHKNYDFQGLVKRRCHSCKCEIAEALSVPCRSDHCHKFFCQKCLTSRYKYSKAKAATLPSLNWKCPVCTRRCFCIECEEAGLIAKRKKPVYKRDMYTVRKRRVKKRPRPKRGLQAQPRLEACRICGNERRDSGATGGTCTYCASPNEANQSAPSPRPVPHQLPEPQPLMFTFGGALAAKDAVDERDNRPFGVTLAARGVLYPAAAYEEMHVWECMRIALAPFTQIY